MTTLDGHVSAFSFLGGVPQSILYDNTKLTVAKILGDGKRQRTRASTELQSQYLFDDRFRRPGKGNDKGKVEGLVGYARRNPRLFVRYDGGANGNADDVQQSMPLATVNPFPHCFHAHLHNR